MFEDSISQRPDGGDMGKEERRQVVLSFLNEHPLALPPKIIYRNLRLHRQITFSEDSVENYLEEFVEEGLVDRIEKEPLDDGRIEQADDDYSRAYYLITDEGRNYADD